VIDRKDWTLKRLAWAYGCAPKDSYEEKELGRALVSRVVEEYRKAETAE
jgi:hypothetical protein